VADDESRPDEPTSTFVGTFNMPVSPHAAAEALQNTLRNIEDARRKAERARANQERLVEKLLDGESLPTDPPSRRTSSRPRRRRRGEPGVDPKQYPTNTVINAIRHWRKGGDNPNQSEISRRTGLSRTAVRRIGRLDDLGAFKLGPRGGLHLLGIDGRFRAARASVSLKALEAALDLEPFS
jgi:hypothetical protein